MRKLSILFFSILILLISSCGEEKGTTEEVLEEDVFEQLPFHRKEGIDSCLVISHRVKDFETWKAAYELAQPIREKHKIYTQRIFRGYDDENIAMVFTEVHDVNLAKEYVTSPNLKKSMETAGVEGEMNLKWLKEYFETNEESKRECIVFMSFRVTDYEKWSQAFIEDYENDPDKGFDIMHVFRSIENPDEVSMFFAADNPEFVKKMESNNSFRMKMIASGVISYPQTYMLKEVPM